LHILLILPGRSSTGLAGVGGIWFAQLKGNGHLTNKVKIMKSTSALSNGTRLAYLSAGLAILLAGCASPDEQSFNEQFRDNLPTNPQYYIKDEGDRHFTIVVQQGSPSTLPNRVIDQKKAATTVAETETRRLGWDKWHLDYISERDQGWMHIVVARVTREVYQGSGGSN
jgi:hypothetical protein